MVVNGEKNMQKEEMRQAIEWMKQGEEEGFNYIYGETYNFVYSRARLAINDEQEVQDLIQEVYVAAYRNIKSLKNSDSLYAWLATITMRQGASMIRKKENYVLLSEENQGMFEEIPDESVELENDAIVKENAGILKGLLEKLSPEQKSAMVSFYYDGLKVEQIAELTETSAGTIKSRLHLARKRLQEYIVELEKKEGCSLRGFSAPLLLLAIRMLLEETTLSKVSAQGIYNQVCTQVGVKATALAFQSAGAGNVAMATSAKAAGIGKGLKTRLTGQMKGQGTGMNKLLGKLAGLGKVKIAAIVTGTVVVAGAGTATGVYVHQQAEVKEVQAQEQAEAEKKAQEELIADMTERYEKAEELRDNLLLDDESLKSVNQSLADIKKALDEKMADSKTEDDMTALEEKLEICRQQNEQYLAEKEAVLTDYHTDQFPQEKQEEFDTAMAEYKSLVKAVKYKEANAKLDEVSANITAFLQESHIEETVEIAQNDTEETSEKDTSGNENSRNNNSDRNGSSSNGNTAKPSQGTSSGGSDSGSSAEAQPQGPSEDELYPELWPGQSMQSRMAHARYNLYSMTNYTDASGVTYYGFYSVPAINGPDHESHNECIDKIWEKYSGVTVDIDLGDTETYVFFCGIPIG